MYVAGGLTTDGTRLSSVESYDLPNNAWFPCAPLREARSSAMAFSVGSKFFVVGGENGRSADKDDGVLRTMEVYDEDLGSPHFQYGVSMPSPRCAASFGVIDGKFILAGGRGPGFEMLTSTIVYDVQSETWTECSSMPESACVYAQVCACECACVGACVCMCGCMCVCQPHHTHSHTQQEGTTYLALGKPSATCRPAKPRPHQLAHAGAKSSSAGRFICMRLWFEF